MPPPAVVKQISAEEALAELEKIMASDDTGAARQFYEWHKRHDKPLTRMTTKSVSAILAELSRSKMATRPSKHASWRGCMAAAKRVSVWKQRHPDYSQARRDAGLVPYIPTADSLRALAYLSLDDRDIPVHIKMKFADLGLLWHLRGDDNLPHHPWWSGVSLDDDLWRSENMAKGPTWAKKLTMDVDRFLELLHTIFGNAGLADHLA